MIVAVAGSWWWGVWVHGGSGDRERNYGLQKACIKSKKVRSLNKYERINNSTAIFNLNQC